LENGFFFERVAPDVEVVADPFPEAGVGADFFERDAGDLLLGAVFPVGAVADDAGILLSAAKFEQKEPGGALDGLGAYELRGVQLGEADINPVHGTPPW
jgi:hypothetical protein